MIDISASTANAMHPPIIAFLTDMESLPAMKIQIIRFLII